MGPGMAEGECTHSTAIGTGPVAIEEKKKDITQKCVKYVCLYMDMYIYIFCVTLHPKNIIYTEKLSLRI